MSVTIRWMGESVLLAAERMAAEGVAGAAQAVRDVSLARVPIASGQLAGSCTVEQNGLEARVKYGSDHAVVVHEGSAKMPGRPFLRDALDVTDLAALAARTLRF